MGREEHCKQILLVHLGSAHSIWTTLGLPQLTACVLSQCTLLRLQVALQRNCSKRTLSFMHFPGLSCSGSGSWVLHKGTDLFGPEFCPSQVQPAQATRCLVSTFSPGGRCILSPPWSQPFGFLGVQWGHHLRCAVCLLWGADLWLWPSWPISIIQDPRKTWLATGSLIAVW